MGGARDGNDVTRPEPTVAVVTGAASGMGRACVDELRGLVDVVIASDLVAPEVDSTVCVACDVADPSAVLELAGTAAAHGRFRALAHCAGISPTMGTPRRILQVDLVGTRLLLDAFEPLVMAGSAAVCFASLAAHQIGPYIDDEIEGLLADPLAPGFLDRAAALLDDSGLAYAVAKAGVIRVAGAAALRWGPSGGRVVSLSPGLIDTAMGRQELADQEAMRSMLSHTPLGRMGRPEELAAVARFLLDDAASFVSGVDVLVDGGLHRALTETASPSGDD